MINKMRILTLLSAFVSLNKKLSDMLSNHYPRLFADFERSNFDLTQEILGYVEEKNAHLKILEVGGIDRPILPKSKDYLYIGMDIEEKPECHKLYDEFIVNSIEEPIDAKCDLIISCTLLEHVKNNEASFKSMYRTLNEKGVMIHYLPSKYHPYSICLRLVGPRLQKILIRYLRPEAIGVSGYPAYFCNCSPAEIEKLAFRIGFKKVNVRVYYNAAEYFSFFAPMFVLVSLFERICALFNIRIFASGMILNAEK